MPEPVWKHNSFGFDITYLGGGNFPTPFNDTQWHDLYVSMPSKPHDTPALLARYSNQPRDCAVDFSHDMGRLSPALQEAYKLAVEKGLVQKPSIPVPQTQDLKARLKSIEQLAQELLEYAIRPEPVYASSLEFRIKQIIKKATLEEK